MRHPVAERAVQVKGRNGKRKKRKEVESDTRNRGNSLQKGRKGQRRKKGRRMKTKNIERKTEGNKKATKKQNK
jgi:hypothetical protein